MNGLSLFVIGSFSSLLVGMRIERRHYKSILSREHETRFIPVATINGIEENRIVADVWFVSGASVISVDYFRRVLASIRGVLGGRIVAYESILDRARREALLRMKENAIGADAIIDVRIDGASIVGDMKSAGQSTAGVEIIAYGTAVRYRS